MPGPADRATNLRLTTLLDVWWEPKKPTLAATTAREYQRVIDTRLKPDLGATHLDRLLPFHLDRYYAQLQREGLRPGSIRQIHAVLRGALGQAHRWGWLSNDPAPATSPPRRRAPDIEPPTSAQARRILACAEAVSPEFGLLVRLATVIRARRGELCSLRWQDMDLDAQTLTIRTGIADVADRLVHRQPWTTLNTYAAFLPERDHAAADHLASLLGDR